MLKNIAATKGLLYGAAINSGHVIGTRAIHTAMAELVRRECSIVTAESDTQWMAIRPNSATFTFTRVDRLAQFCSSNSIPLRGHALLWHTLPLWTEIEINALNAEAMLTEHITRVATYLEGKISQWNVVNEVASPSGLRDTMWLRYLGERYIDLAFHLTKQCCSATRFYNENRMEYDTWEMNNKRASVLRLLERLVSSGVPIDGLGIQAHLFPNLPFSETKYSAFLRDVAAMGLKILITECDVTDRELPADIPQRDQMVADTYRRYLDVALAEPAVTGLITWGITDRHTWLSTARPRYDGLPVRPLPFDDQLAPKLAYQAIYDAIANAPVR